MPKSHQVLARRYRPQTFQEIVGQDALVKTLINSIKSGKLAHAYLFSGSRGTGKTTTARIFAKALNCKNRSEEMEPCNNCASCKEITAGTSLDVLEIDGASNRGIEDVRKINDTAGYSASAGGYKIYLIDEVHMLTNEAFNALLKTLEEPPAKVKFFFATTEQHKVLPTILSRCQKYHLNRIPEELITQKLREIMADLSLSAEDEALRMIALMADGGLRDAESLLDQVLAFHEGAITAEIVSTVLGTTTKQAFFSLDQAAKEGNLSYAFTLIDEIYRQGKDLIYFLESLTNHFRTILTLHTAGATAPGLNLTEAEKTSYSKACQIYNPDQTLQAVELLLKTGQEIKTSPSVRITLEALLVRLMRMQKRIPLETLVGRLEELEMRLSEGATPSQEAVDPTPKASEIPPPPKKAPKPPAPKQVAAPPVAKPPEPKKTIKPPEPKKAETAPLQERKKPTDQKTQTRYDALMQFAAVELEGTVERK